MIPVLKRNGKAEGEIAWLSGVECGTVHYSRQAQSVVKLFTGGKARPGQQRLFALTGMLQPARYDWALGGGQFVGDGVVPGEATIWGDLGPADADYTAWGALANGQTVDVTPRTGDPTLSLAALASGAGPNTGRVNPANANMPTVAGFALTLKTLTFSGATTGAYYDVVSDPNWSNASYGPEHWRTNTLTHTVESFPALYVSGSTVQASLTFSVTGLPVASMLVVKGVASGGGVSFTLWGTNAITAGATVWSATVVADTNLPNSRVDFLNPLTISWSFSRTNRDEFTPAGKSTNQVYVSLQPRLGDAPLFHTVVHLACSTPGATNEDQAVTNTWSKFTGRSIKTWNGLPLTYYGTPYGHYANTLAGLLVWHDGQCTAFGDLLIDAFRVNGIGSVKGTIVAPPGTNMNFLINNIVISGAGQFPNDSDGYVYGEGNIDRTVPGIAGQNMETPSSKGFNIHALVHRGTSNEYYDPSYGNRITGPTNFASYIAAWGILTNNVQQWKPSAGSGLVPLFLDK